MSQRPNIEELLCDYLDGTLDAARQRQLETLLKRHAKLRKVLAQMQQARGMLRELPVEKLPADAAAELQAKLREPEPMRLYSRPWLIRLAASVALAVTGGLIIWTMLPSSAPMAERTVAFDARPASPAPAPTEMLAKKDDTGATRMAEAEADADSEGENEPAVMVVLADDIRGTQREIRDLLTSNNISYESVNPPAEVRQEMGEVQEEIAKENRGQMMAKAAPDAMPAAPAPAPAGPAPAAAPAPMAKTEAATPPAAQAPLSVDERLAAPSVAGEAKQKVLADEAGQEQMAGGGGASPETARAIARAVESARQVGAPVQQKSQAGGAQAAGDVYGVVVARNVTSDQLGKIRSGLRDASRSRNLRVVDAPVDRQSQMFFSRDQAANRADTQDQYQQTQDRQQVAVAEPQRRISYSARYDVTIVVQGETAAGAAATQGNIPTWPLPATRPSGTLPATAPVGR